MSTKKHSIEVRRYLPGNSQYGSESIGKINGDYGKYEVVETVKRVLKVESIGNFNPVFCHYNGHRRVLVHSEEGDISDPFRADGSYLKKLFICLPKRFQLGDRVMLLSPADREQFHAMDHGVVVKYRGEHDPENPRVRWASGWGVTSKSAELRLMSADECAQFPVPALVDSDL